MMKAVFQRATLSTLLALALSACGGGGGSDSSVTPSEPAVNCASAADAPAACDLRMYQVMVESFVNGDDTINYDVGYGPSNHNQHRSGILRQR